MNQQVQHLQRPLWDALILSVPLSVLRVSLPGKWGDGSGLVHMHPIKGEFLKKLLLKEVVMDGGLQK